MVGGIGVSDLPFLRLPTICVARLDPETETENRDNAVKTIREKVSDNTE